MWMSDQDVASIANNVAKRLFPAYANVGAHTRLCIPNNHGSEVSLFEIVNEVVKKINPEGKDGPGVREWLSDI